jgi:hypothetical protein
MKIVLYFLEEGIRVRECALFKILLYNICSNPWLLVLAFSFLFFIYLCFLMYIVLEYGGAATP